MSDDNYAPTMSSSSRRRPSQDTTTRRSEDRERDYGRRPGGSSISATSDGTVNPAQSTTATSGMIIPNKSTMEEEYIEVPYGRDPRESVGTTVDDSRQDTGPGGGLTDPEPDSASDYPSPMSPRSPPPVGLSGLSARLKGVEDSDRDSDFYNRSSAGLERSSSITSRLGTARQEDTDKMKRDYEYRIATMQSQITNMQRELGDAEQRDRKLKESDSKVQQLEDELVMVRKVCIANSPNHSNGQ